MKNAVRWLVVGAVLFLPLLLARAQPPVVMGVFFYSPFCGHCRLVIEQHWPGIQQEFGDALQVLFINASMPEGGQLMQLAREALKIEAQGVPMLIIGSEVLVGSMEIPERAPQVIRAGLAAGGVALPPIPGIEALYQQVVASAPVEPEAASAPAVEVAPPSVSERLAADPLANGLAVVTLALLAFGVLAALVSGYRALARDDDRLLEIIAGRAGWWMLVLLALGGLSLAVSLVLGAHTLEVVLLSGGTTLAMLILFIGLLVEPLLRSARGWMPPLLVAAGLLVAGYLAYVEVNAVKATCGVVGDCNAVQQSPYAQIFGVPVGVIGVLGYVLMLLVWLVGRMGYRWADGALLLLALVGTAFSTYLTFLEPFVIGATCFWCLTSALVMLMLLWLALPDGWRALRRPASFPARRAAAAE